MRIVFFAMIVATSAAISALADTTVITNRAGLAAISNDLAGTYLLAADIDLAGIEWTPLGFDNESFSGKFYGNGHVISHLVVTNHPAGLCLPDLDPAPLKTFFKWRMVFTE